MGHQVIWTDEAIGDLRQLVAFIARDNPTAAVKLGGELIRKSMLLAEFPRLGRRLRESNCDTLHQIIVAPYRLIYEIDDISRTVRVRVLWHGARQEPDLGGNELHDAIVPYGTRRFFTAIAAMSLDPPSSSSRLITFRNAFISGVLLLAPLIVTTGRPG